MNLREWFLRRNLVANSLSQLSHLKFFIPECVKLWICSRWDVRNEAPHSEHRCLLIFESPTAGICWVSSLMVLSSGSLYSSLVFLSCFWSADIGSSSSESGSSSSCKQSKNKDSSYNTSCLISCFAFFLVLLSLTFSSHLNSGFLRSSYDFIHNWRNSNEVNNLFLHSWQILRFLLFISSLVKSWYSLCSATVMAVNTVSAAGAKQARQVWRCILKI